MTDRQTDKQTDRQTHTHTDRQTEWKSEKHTFFQRYNYYRNRCCRLHYGLDVRHCTSALWYCDCTCVCVCVFTCMTSEGKYPANFSFEKTATFKLLHRIPVLVQCFKAIWPNLERPINEQFKQSSYISYHQYCQYWATSFNLHTKFDSEFTGYYTKSGEYLS